jgi:biopolymer transport protein ExbB
MEWIKLYTDYAIFGVLGFMSFISLGLSIERMLYFRSLKVENYKNKHLLENDLTHNLTVLSTIGSNAPYVGLLGTVIGIMVTFYDMGHHGKLDNTAILVGLSLALKATALGLLVAIPTLMFYSAFVRKVDININLWKSKHEA